MWSLEDSSSNGKWTKENVLHDENQLNAYQLKTDKAINNELLLTESNVPPRRNEQYLGLCERHLGRSADSGKIFADRFYVTPGWMSCTYGVVEYTVQCGPEKYQQVHNLTFELTLSEYEYFI